MDTVLLYLAKHGQHVDSISLSGPLFEDPPEPRRVPEQSTVSIRHLPSSRQLSSLQLHELHLQLQPGHGFQGVLGAAEGIAALKKLEISSCQLLDEAASQALAAALSQLPAGLEHFSMSGLTNGKSWVSFPTGKLQRLQQLTYLELAHGKLQGSGQGQLALQPLQALTRLVDLRLAHAPIKNDAPTVLSASMLSGAHNLTRLHVFGNYGYDEVVVDPAVLAGKTQLQHLQLAYAGFTSGAAGVAQLLSHLQPLQQLTHLDLRDSLSNVGQGNPPAAAYSALTASSKLQHLDISYCTLPAGVFRHVFPAGRQLPHLRSLDLHWVKQAGASWDGIPALAPEGSRLVSCCPGLQLLNVANLQYSAELLASLHGLSQLHTLRWHGSSPVLLTGLQKLCQLTGLRELSVALALNAAEEVLPLTELKQLTSLALQGVPGDSNLRPSIFRQHVSSADLSSALVDCSPACQTCLRAALRLAGTWS
jgi:hypothetical protein